MMASSSASPMVSGTKMKWNTVVIPNCQRESMSVIADYSISHQMANLGAKVPKVIAITMKIV
jgi:hypothetical protein